MSLRRRVPDARSTYDDPVLGVNLRESLDDLQRGEARQMQNVHYESGTRLRNGSTRLTSTALMLGVPIRGGHMFYYGETGSSRLVVYGTNCSTLSAAGTETILFTGLTNDRATQFLTFPVVDKVYLANGIDELYEYDGTTFQATSVVAGAANVPGNGGNPPARQLGRFRDRLLAITDQGIEVSGPSQPQIWSSDSSWSTFRPIEPGIFNAIAPHTTAFANSNVAGMLAIQTNAYYFLSGTDFGADVTAASPPAGLDTEIQLINSRVGTQSPNSVEFVPGLGTFWFTTDLNVWWIPQGQTQGRFVADKLVSDGTIQGLESVNRAALSSVWMRYFNRKLILSVPYGNDLFTTSQWWLDIRSLQEHPERDAVWYGPMTGQSSNIGWTENALNDNRLMMGEGNPALGAYVYEGLVSGIYQDAVGASDVDFPYVYQTYAKSFGTPSLEKYIKSLELEANAFTGDATVDLHDLTGELAVDLPIELSSV